MSINEAAAWGEWKTLRAKSSELALFIALSLDLDERAPAFNAGSSRPYLALFQLYPSPWDRELRVNSNCVLRAHAASSKAYSRDPGVP